MAQVEEVTVLPSASTEESKGDFKEVLQLGDQEPIQILIWGNVSSCSLQTAYLSCARQDEGAVECLDARGEKYNKLVEYTNCIRDI